MGGGKHEETILRDGRIQRCALCLPVGDQVLERARIDDGAGEDVRSDFGALLEHAYADFAAVLRSELLETDRSSEPRRSATDDDHVVFHRFARHSPVRSLYLLPL